MKIKINEADELHAKINNILNNITDTLSILSKTSATSQASVSAVGLQQAESTTVTPKLPKLTLEKFKGGVTTFQSFWDSFSSTKREEIVYCEVTQRTE